MEETFKHVGPRVDPGDVRISDDEVQLFRSTALLGSRIRNLSVDNESSYIWASSYATGVLSDAAADYGVDETAFFSKSTAGIKPAYWRSTITFARYNQAHADTKIYNIFEVEAADGEVIAAKRKVRIIRNLVRFVFDEEGEPIEDAYSRQRRAFEHPMTPEDVAQVAIRVDRVMRRQRATTRQK